MKKKMYILIGAVLIILIAITLYFKRNNKVVLHPKVGKVIETVYGIGVVKSRQIFHAKISVNSIIDKFFVTEGSFVHKGDALVKFSEGLVLKAPFEGTVTTVFLNAGELVTAQNEILVMQNLNELYVEVSLEQQGAIKVRPKTVARLSFDTLSSDVVKGNVEAVLPQEDKFVVRVDSSELPKNILPGMSVDVTFDVSEKDNAVLVPLKAVMNGQLMIRRDHKKMRLNVITGIKDNENIEIINPKIEATDEVVVDF